MTPCRHDSEKDSTSLASKHPMMDAWLKLMPHVA
jgi:hypothetical protein